MRRRSVLRWGVALATGAIAGCVGDSGEVPVTAPEPPSAVGADDGGDSGGSEGTDRDSASETPQQRFQIPDRTFESADDDHLVVVVTVENRSESNHEAVMTVEITAGEKAFSLSELVSLRPGARRAVQFHVPVPYEEFQVDPGFDVRFDPGRPATPLPDGTVTPYPEDRETETDGNETTGADENSTATG